VHFRFSHNFLSTKNLAESRTVLETGRDERSKTHLFSGWRRDGKKFWPWRGTYSTGWVRDDQWGLGVSLVMAVTRRQPNVHAFRGCARLPATTSHHQRHRPVRLGVGPWSRSARPEGARAKWPASTWRWLLANAHGEARKQPSYGTITVCHYYSGFWQCFCSVFTLLLVHCTTVRTVHSRQISSKSRPGQGGRTSPECKNRVFRVFGGWDSSLMGCWWPVLVVCFVWYNLLQNHRILQCFLSRICTYI